MGEVLCDETTGEKYKHHHQIVRNGETTVHSGCFRCRRFENLPDLQRWGNFRCGCRPAVQQIPRPQKVSEICHWGRQRGLGAQLGFDFSNRTVICRVFGIVEIIEGLPRCDSPSLLFIILNSSLPQTSHRWFPPWSPHARCRYQGRGCGRWGYSAHRWRGGGLGWGELKSYLHRKNAIILTEVVVACVPHADTRVQPPTPQCGWRLMWGY